jgi:hypothetical protein
MQARFLRDALSGDLAGRPSGPKDRRAPRGQDRHRLAKDC